MPVVSSTCYELLGVPVEAPRDQLELAWTERRREAEGRLGALPAESVEALCAQVDEAFRILADPIRAARYRKYRALLDALDPPDLDPDLDTTDPGDSTDPDGTELDPSAPVTPRYLEWGDDPDGISTDPGLPVWRGELSAVTDAVEVPEPVRDLDLLREVIKAAEHSDPLPDPRDTPPWESPDAPVMRNLSDAPLVRPALAPASFGPEQEKQEPTRAPWTR